MELCQCFGGDLEDPLLMSKREAATIAFLVTKAGGNLSVKDVIRYFTPVGEEGDRR